MIKRKQTKKIKEMSTSGAVAPTGSQPLKGYDISKDKEQIRRKKQRDAFMKHGGGKKVVETNEFLKTTIAHVLLEQEQTSKERINWLLKLFEGYMRRIQLSLDYSKMFVIDSMKLDDANFIEKSLNRSKSELDNVKKTIDGLEAILVKAVQLYHADAASAASLNQEKVSENKKK